MLLVVRNKLFFSTSAISIFVLCHIIFLLLGLLTLPWTRETLFSNKLFFSDFNLMTIEETTIVKTILIIVYGLFMVIFSYSIGNLIIKKSPFQIPKGLFNFENIKQWEHGTSIRRVRLFLTLFIMISFIQLIPHTNLILGAMFDTNLYSKLEARRTITQNYFLTVSIYNIIPFLAAVSFTYYESLTQKVFSDRVINFTYTLLTAILLLLTFQKRPLILFLLTLIVLKYLVRRGALGIKDTNFMGKFRKYTYFSIGFLGLFIVLMYLYVKNTNYAESAGSIWELMYITILISLSRIIGRLSLPSVMYVDYFPNIESFYGLSNIGMLSNILQKETYLDSKVVYQYFAGNDNGSLAASSIIDFYGGFGIIGVTIGCLIIGLILRYIDYLFITMKPNTINKVFQVYLLISVFYLSQASLPRTFMGYGGIFFVIFWFLLRYRFIRL